MTYEAWRISYQSSEQAARAAYAEMEAMRRDAARFTHLQNIDPKEAQAFFWNYSSRKQRAAAIDAAMAHEGSHVPDA